ncbi:UNVERIFIED_CONTAM: hypothetical protein Slati_2156200 [Sesamum latifolium]|uniref:MULE transposase domain-containing protein n=1 Tax=Sesamum latifolium TaxID=2727402 RepID=A0AAW2WSC6_9LAMI
MSEGVYMGEGEEDDGHGIEEVDVGETVRNDGNEGVNANESEGVAGIEEVDVGEAVENDGNEGVNANESEGAVGTEEVDVGEGEGGESESNSDASSASECPSWMLEDLEGLWNDEIFSNRPENYTRTMLRTLRSFIKEKRKKRQEDKQNQRGETSGMGVEQWFSDCEEEELRSVRGSDDEGERCPEWNDRMDMGEGLYKGQLLAAIGRDPNDNIYPIAFAFVEVEKFDSWLWFLKLLLRDIGSQEEKGWAFISDRQKWLIDAVSELAPGAEHRFCLRHV